MIGATSSAFRRLISALRAGSVDTAQQLQRIGSMERNIGLPVRAGLIVLVGYYLFYSRWLSEVATSSEVVLEWVRGLLVTYIAINLIASVALVFMRRLGWGLMRWVVFAICMMDGFFLASVHLVVGGRDSATFWIFCVLIVRNALSIPVATLQFILNASVCVFYVASMVAQRFTEQSEAADPDAYPMGDEDFEMTVIRMTLLLLLSACCYGVQVLYERNMRALAQSREQRARQGQLTTAGRMAAAIAHQIKNPLAIINNAAFNLQRGPAGADSAAARQLEIIREEVDRADGIITRIMGYAELSEPRVEPVNPRELIESALRQVFPPGLPTGVRVETDLSNDAPTMFLQRRHLEEALVNLLQNAREAVGERGVVRVGLRQQAEDWVEFTFEDDGPGVPAELRTRVFEPYFTTKPKGSGLGLAIVQHHCELYGGRVRVESPLGKGARFVLELPAKTHPST
jgi:signal transduction histidine kinase